MGGVPGGLDELGAEGKAAWAHAIADLVSKEHMPPGLHAAPTRATGERTSIEWAAYPERIEACVGRAQAHRLLDRGARGRGFQEEYAEWRMVRDADGTARRFELTTELAAYWEVLATHEPDRTVDLVSEFAGEPVAAEQLYGADPATMDPPARRKAFRKAARGPLNDGRKAICCMIQPTNTLSGIVHLAAGSARPRWVVDAHSGDARAMSGREAIAAARGPFADFAQDCRNSDPLIVDRLVKLANEGRVIALDDPVGIYITSVARHELALPGGDDVPQEWFEFGRGEARRDRPLFQRLTFEVPAGTGFGLGDLTSRRTDTKIEHGAQIAELVQVALYLRTGAAAARPPKPDPEPRPRLVPCSEQQGCAEVRKAVKA